MKYLQYHRAENTTIRLVKDILFYIDVISRKENVLCSKIVGKFLVNEY